MARKRLLRRTGQGLVTRQVSIVDVAREARVSVATASRILSNSDYPVSPETRARVLEAARRLDYVPDAFARALVRRRTGIIALTVHDIADPYFAEIARAVEDACQADGYRALICSTDRDPDKEIRVIRSFRAFRPDGLILGGGCVEDPAHVENLRREIASLTVRGTRVVALSRHPTGVPMVRVDNVAVARAATEHVISLGHRRIACICGQPNFTTSTDRFEGYRQALAAHDIPFDPNLVVVGWYTWEGGYQAARELLARGVDFSALVASTDIMAIGALVALREAGIDVPDRVSLVSMNDLPIASVVEPPLTAVSFRGRDLGALAVRLILDALEGQEIPQDTVLGFELKVRRSTRPLTD
jgi:LacI family transcriptional regulator